MSIPAGLREFQNLSPQQWLDRASRTLPQAVCAVLVITIAWQLVQLTWLLLERRSDGSTAEAIAPYTPPPNPARKGIDVQTIVNAHLFGVPQTETPQDSTNAPQTQMNLVLSAVFAADDPAKGLAIIGDSAQSAKVYTRRRRRAPGHKAPRGLRRPRHP